MKNTKFRNLNDSKQINFGKYLDDKSCFKSKTFSCASLNYKTKNSFEKSSFDKNPNSNRNSTSKIVTKNIPESGSNISSRQSSTQCQVQSFSRIKNKISNTSNTTTKEISEVGDVKSVFHSHGKNPNKENMDNNLGICLTSSLFSQDYNKVSLQKPNFKYSYESNSYLNHIYNTNPTDNVLLPYTCKNKNLKNSAIRLNQAENKVQDKENQSSVYNTHSIMGTNENKRGETCTKFKLNSRMFNKIIREKVTVKKPGCLVIKTVNSIQIEKNHPITKHDDMDIELEGLIDDIINYNTNLAEEIEENNYKDCIRNELTGYEFNCKENLKRISTDNNNKNNEMLTKLNTCDKNSLDIIPTEYKKIKLNVKNLSNCKNKENEVSNNLSIFSPTDNLFKKSKSKNGIITEKKDKNYYKFLKELLLYKKYEEELDDNLSVFDFSFSGAEKSKYTNNTNEDITVENQTHSPNFTKFKSPDHKSNKRKIPSAKKYLENEMIAGNIDKRKIPNKGGENIRKILFFENCEINLNSEDKHYEEEKIDTIPKKNLSHVFFSDDQKILDYTTENFPQNTKEFLLNSEVTKTSYNSSCNASCMSKRRVTFSDDNLVHSFNIKRIPLECSKKQKKLNSSGTYSNTNGKGVKSILRSISTKTNTYLKSNQIVNPFPADVYEDNGMNETVEKDIALLKLNQLIMECELDDQIEDENSNTGSKIKGDESKGKKSNREKNAKDYGIPKIPLNGKKNLNKSLAQNNTSQDQDFNQNNSKTSQKQLPKNCFKRQINIEMDSIIKPQFRNSFKAKK